MPASRLLLGLLGATGCAGAALVAVLVRWKKDGTLDDLMSRLAFQISRYAQRHELKFRQVPVPTCPPLASVSRTAPQPNCIRADAGTTRQAGQNLCASTWRERGQR